MKKESKDFERIILGIDPGTSITGFGVLGIKNNKPSLLSMGIIDLRKIKDPYLKLSRIFKDSSSLIEKFHPDELAIEAPFYGKNVQSMLKLGRAQGAAISAALTYSIPIFEYAPRKIKMAITGQGAASKEQVAIMLEKILSFHIESSNLDATDGLAAALCHFYQDRSTTYVSGYKNWNEFLKKNPERVK
jgi:crossover junction endodeoxyribonuclease RuvC